MDKYFSPAGDLELDDKKNSDTYFSSAGDLKFEDKKNSDTYFSPAGDLELEDKKTGDTYFSPAGDLELEDKKNSDTYFRTAGDLDGDILRKEDIDNINNFVAVENIEDYLLSVVSGKRYPYESEMGRVVGAASTVVSFDELKRMVDEGYNIVSASALNSNLIAVEFQCFSKDNDVRRGR